MNQKCLIFVLLSFAWTQNAFAWRSEVGNGLSAFGLAGIGFGGCQMVDADRKGTSSKNWSRECTSTQPDCGKEQHDRYMANGGIMVGIGIALLLGGVHLIKSEKGGKGSKADLPTKPVEAYAELGFGYHPTEHSPVLSLSGSF